MQTQSRPVLQCRLGTVKLAVMYLLTDQAEAPVLSDTFIGFSQHRVKGFVAISERSSGITRDCKGSNIDLQEIKYNNMQINK